MDLTSPIGGPVNTTTATISPDVAGNGSAAKPKTAEITPGPGFRLRWHIERPDLETLDRFAPFETPVISDRMNRLYTMCEAIRSLTPQAPAILGPACTVKVYPGDNLMVHKSLDVAQPGDVVVIDASSATTYSVLGDLVSTKARHRGIRGFVVDGLVRDLPGIRALADFPVFARGVTPIGPLHRGPGEINYPVSVGGIVVHPGDIVVGDESGVVVVPRECAEEVLESLERQKEADAVYAAAVARGKFSTAWVDQALEASGIDLSHR
jgi:regulator of RNase E activity RraA